MFNMFSNFAKGAYLTAEAKLSELPNNFAELKEAQRNRMLASTGVIAHKNYSPEDIAARKQYWYSQILFLIQLPIFSQMLDPDKRELAFLNSSTLCKGINGILARLDDDKFLKELLTQLEKPPTKPVKSMKRVETSDKLKKAEAAVINGDIIEQIKILSKSGHYVIVNDAANSYRDGSSKISKGTVEERIGQFTNGALSLATHFRDVRKDNVRNKLSHIRDVPPRMNVDEYRRRYFKMVLNIMKSMIGNPSYLESPKFFDDLLKPSSHESGMPIYFEMQGEAYEVPPENGFFSERQFQDTSDLSNFNAVFTRTTTPSYPVGITSFAAPDLRKVVAAPLDARATSNKVLANPNEEGVLASMMHKGISFQCQQAIRKSIEQVKEGAEGTVHILFILQGCGAFLNPKRIAAAHFVSTIKGYEKQLKEHKIDFNLVEYDPETAKLLKKTYEEVGTELFELNSAIESIKEPKIKREAIAVRERIMDLYNDGTDYKYLVGLITNTTKLLICPEPNEIQTTINDYETVVSNFRIEETLYTAMLSLLSSIVKVFTGKHTLDKEMAYKESASSLLASSFGQFIKPKYDTHRFLKNVDASDINRVSQKLEKNIALLVQKGEVTDFSGRTFSNISGFQYAILTGRVQVLNAMLDSLPDGRKGESLKKVLKNQYEELKENGASYIESKGSDKSIAHCKLEENKEINLLISPLVLNKNFGSGNNLIR